MALTVQHNLLNVLLALPGIDAEYVRTQIARLSDSDPALTIGTAKEIFETCCKTILHHLSVAYSSTASLHALLKDTLHAIYGSTPTASFTSDVRTILRPLTTLVQNIAEVRNAHGTGHGNISQSSSVGRAEARMVLGAVTTLCVYLGDALPKTNP